MKMTKEKVKNKMRDLKNDERLTLYGFYKRPTGFCMLIEFVVVYNNGNFVFYKKEGFKKENITLEHFKTYLENFPIYDTHVETYHTMKEEVLKCLDI